MNKVDMLITVHFGVLWAASMVVLAFVFAAGIHIGRAMRVDL